MNDNTSYNTFFGLIDKSNKILLEFFDKLYNYKQQLKDAGVELPNLNDESITFFRDYIKDKGRLNAVVLGNAESNILQIAMKEYEKDANVLSKESLMNKYELKDNESFSIPYISYLKGKESTVLMLRDCDVANLTQLMLYIVNHKELYKNMGYDVNNLFDGYLDKNNIENIKEDLNAEKVEILFDNKKQKDLITNEMQSLGIKFQINYHEKNVGAIFNKMQEINGSTGYVDVAKLLANDIIKLKGLEPEEQAKLIWENMKYLNSRENSVKEMEKALDEKGR